MVTRKVKKVVDIDESNGSTSKLLRVMQQNLTTDESKIMAINFLDDLGQKIPLKNKNGYEDNEHKEAYAELIFYLYIGLNQVEKGIKYYRKNVSEITKEITEYRVLNILGNFDLYEEWIKEYES